MIYFKTIRWRNFLSTGNTFTEIKLNEHNTTLIVGENGAGKSTLLDAISFVLYNKPFRKINKPQLLNSINKKNLVVEIEFNIGSGMYKVVRGLKPAIFEVYQNNKLLNQNAESRDYQEILENQILKLNHKSFCQVVVLGSASFIPFMQLTAQNRREVIEDLLDIQIFSTMNSLLKEDVSENNKRIQQADYNFSLIKEKIAMQHDFIDKLQKDNDKRIAELKLELEDHTNRIDKEKFSIEENNTNIEKLRLLIADEEKVKQKLQKLKVLEGQMNTKIERLKEEITFFHSYDNCPTCKQDIDDKFKCDTVSSHEDQIKAITDGIDKLNQEMETILERIQFISNTSSEITDYNLKNMAHNSNINGLIQNCKKIAKEIESLQNKFEDESFNGSEIKDLEVKLEEAAQEKSELLKHKDALTVTSMVLKDSGIKARIIKQYIPVINKLINKYLASMDFFVNFELDENFNESIKSRFRDEFSYASFSEGEKMRINLAILFTWRAVAKMRNSASTNILIMDEVLDSSLDYNGTSEFLKILSNLTKDTNTFIISHKTDQMVDKFNNVIKFEKNKNFSRIAA